jgi:hypothetical protein
VAEPALVGAVVLVGEGMKYAYIIPAVPPSLNDWKRMSMYPAARAQRAFQQMLWAVLNEAGNKCPRGLQHVTCRAVLTFAHNRRHDPTNYGATLWKFATDVLVREGIISDDTAEHVTCIEPGIVIGESEQTFLVIETGGQP